MFSQVCPNAKVVNFEHSREGSTFCPLDQPFSMGVPWGGLGTFEEGHRLETILHIPPYEVRYVTYTILIWPIFLSY